MKLSILAFGAIVAYGQTSVPGRILVGPKPGVTNENIEKRFASLQARSTGTIPGLGVHIVSLPSGANEHAYLNAFKGMPEVEFAELDSVVVPAEITPNDPWYGNWEWHLAKISAPAAWSISTGSSSVVIAIIDTGVYAGHPDLSAKLVPGWNSYNNTANTADVYGHGTAVAGIAAAQSNNGLGVASICWNCLVMPIKATDDQAVGTYSTFASGLTWAADHGARIANISFGVTDSSTVTAAAQYFQSKGGVVIASAGNSGTFDASNDNPYILTVSSTDANDALYSFSNTGNNVDLSAPGCAYTTTLSGGYASACGTSGSAPIVAGVAALVLSAAPGMSPADIVKTLQQSADDLGASGWDSRFGWGRVNASRALSQAGSAPADTTPPAVAIASPAPGTIVSGAVAIQVSASDNVGIASLTIAQDGNTLCVITAPPFTCYWNTGTAPAGAHTISANARDAAGNGSIASTTVTVASAGPVVSITSPGTGSRVSGNVTIQVSASDPVGIASVAIAVDGSTVCTVTVAPYACPWNTAASTVGSHTLAATARNSLGSVGSASLTVTVTDTTAPAVTISSPGLGATVSGNVAVTARYTDNVGVVKAAFYVDGVLNATSTSAPFSFKWNAQKISAGSHSLVIKAYDAAGNVGASPALTVYK